MVWGVRKGLRVCERVTCVYMWYGACEKGGRFGKGGKKVVGLL